MFGVDHERILGRGKRFEEKMIRKSAVVSRGDLVPNGGVELPTK